MSGEQEINLDDFNYNKANIKIFKREELDTKRDNEKQLKKIQAQLDKKLTEKDKWKLLRDESRDKAQTFFNKSKQSREKRDEVNEKISELKKERKAHYKDRDRIAEEKKHVVEKLNSSDDNKEKQELYQKLQEVKKELSECYDKANAVHEQIQELADQSQNYHVEMKTYRMMGKQAHSTADEHHKKVVKISNEIMNLFEQRDKLQRG